MSAPDNIQSMALADLVRIYGWTRMAILVDNSAYGMYLFLTHNVQIIFLNMNMNYSLAAVIR